MNPEMAVCEPRTTQGRAFGTRPLPAAAAVCALALLAGCAGAHVVDVTSTKVVAPAPAEILVASEVAPELTASRDAQQVGSDLRQAIIKRLSEAGVTAEPFVPGTSHPGGAVLRISIIEADPGNLAERLVIGFGAGKAQLQIKADLQVSDAGGPPLTTFSAVSDSGAKPGLILPGGIALATGKVIHLIIGGGIDVAFNVRGGLSRPVRGTATAVVDQVKKYYAVAGWQWPVQAHA